MDQPRQHPLSATEKNLQGWDEILSLLQRLQSADSFSKSKLMIIQCWAPKYFFVVA